MLYQNVEKVSLKDIISSEYEFPKSKTHAIIEIDGESKKILLLCSKNYNIALNCNVFKPMEKFLLKNDYKFNTKTQIIDGTKFYINYTILHRINSKHIAGLFPVLSLWNSYDGTLKTQVHFGYYSQIYNTYLSTPNIKASVHASKHMPSNITAVEFDKNTISVFFQQFKEFMKNIIQDIKSFETLCKKQADTSMIDIIVKELKLSRQIKALSLKSFNNKISTYANEMGDKVINFNKNNTMFSLYISILNAINTVNNKEPLEVKLRKDKNLFLCVSSLC